MKYKKSKQQTFTLQPSEIYEGMFVLRFNYKKDEHNHNAHISNFTIKELKEIRMLIDNTLKEVKE